MAPEAPLEALPDPLRQLEPPKIGDTATQKARARELFDKREAYRFTPLARRRDERGSQRWKGPAVAGHLRCPNTSASMRLGRHLPTARCVRGGTFACGKTVTVLDTDLERDRQPLPWQSTRWALSFNRRSLIEGLNAQLRYQVRNVNRGYFRVPGLVATTLLMEWRSRRTTSRDSGAGISPGTSRTRGRSSSVKNRRPNRWTATPGRKASAARTAGSRLSTVV